MLTRLNMKTSPELAKLKPGLLDLRWSKHATAQSNVKQVLRAGQLLAGAGSVVEVELVKDRKQIAKMVVRLPCCDDWDSVYVLVPDSAIAGGWFVVTCWLNRATDNHQTLRMERLGNVG